MTARRGVRTRVETTVAMELAESWNPFKKSKTRARRIKNIMLVVIHAVSGLKISEGKIKPTIGEMNIKVTVLMIPFETSAPIPALTSAEPIIPPINACEELVGNPKYQVMMFLRQAPVSVPKMIV